MRRIVHLIVLLLLLSASTAFRSGHPGSAGNPLAYNTPMAHFFYPALREAPAGMDQVLHLEPDTFVQLQVLMLDYSEYGSAYNEKVRQMISKYLPKTNFSIFSEGNAVDLERALSGVDVVVAAYPSAASGLDLRSIGKTLQQFAQQGGAVILTGTHEFEVLQQFGLFDLDFGYFSKEIPIKAAAQDHPMLNGVDASSALSNFTYPLDISDPAFVTLADVGGYPAVGYKLAGLGKIVYLGIEYYYEEAVPSMLLVNALHWSANIKATHDNITPTFSAKLAKRSEEVLYAGSGRKSDPIDLKIYPNPYVNKATLDIELTKVANVRIEMTDEMGRSAALILPKKQLNPGLCRFELPNISPGIYFLQIQIGDQVYMRKVVKSASN